MDHAHHKRGGLLSGRRPMRDMEEKGRRGDTTVGHLTPGEVVVPKAVLAIPGIEEALRHGFEEAGVDWSRYEVGGEGDSRNPETGAREYGHEGDNPGGGYEGPGGSYGVSNDPSQGVSGGPSSDQGSQSPSFDPVERSIQIADQIAKEMGEKNMQETAERDAAARRVENQERDELEADAKARAGAPPTTGFWDGLTWRDLPIISSIDDLISPFNALPGPPKGMGAKGISAAGGALTGLLTGGASTATRALGAAGSASRVASNIMGGMSPAEAAVRGVVPGVAVDVAKNVVGGWSPFARDDEAAPEEQKGPTAVAAKGPTARSTSKRDDDERRSDDDDRLSGGGGDDRLAESAPPKPAAPSEAADVQSESASPAPSGGLLSRPDLSYLRNQPPRPTPAQRFQTNAYLGGTFKLDETTGKIVFVPPQAA